MESLKNPFSVLLCGFFIPLFMNSITATGQTINHWSLLVDDPTSSHQPLWGAGNKTSLVQSRCDRQTLLYTRGLAYLTRDGFTTAVDPMYIPTQLLQNIQGPPTLQSATFTGDSLLLANSGTVFSYNLNTNQLSRANGIPSDVNITSLASFQCCFNDTEWCEKQDSSVIAYSNHSSVSSTSDTIDYFYSLDAGQTFSARQLKLDFSIKGGILGATVLGSLSAFAFLVAKDNSARAQFVYDSISQASTDLIKEITSLPFDVVGEQMSFVQLESGAGSILIWDERNIYYSPVSGQAVVKAVTYSQDPTTSATSNETVQQVITSYYPDGDMALLTSEGNLFFGREGMPAKFVKLPLQNPLLCHGQSCVVKFEQSTSNIQVLYPAIGVGDLPPPTSKLQMVSKVVNVQRLLADVTPALQKCQLQGFEARFHNKLFYLDLGQKLKLSAKVIPIAWEQVTSMVTVSNPKIVSVNTSREVSSPLAKGVTTTILSAQVSLVADTLHRGRKDEARGMSSVRMSVYDSSLMCHHKQHAVAHVIAGCPPNRNIRVRKKEDECANMRNYVYTIDKETYDPSFLLGSTGIPASEDKEVLYDYDRLGCPIVVYYQDLLKPVIDLYEGDTFIEEVKKDYVVNEIHGMFTYSYNQTAKEAGCKSQPQNWLSLLSAQDIPDPATAWTRLNYRSCMQEDTRGLTNPNQPYEVLSSHNTTHLKWRPYNGILVFNVSVLNPDYSYCQLRGQFAVRVYGVLPTSTLAPMRIMLGSCGLGLVALVAYYAYWMVWSKNTEKKDKRKEKEANKQDD